MGIESALTPSIGVYSITVQSNFDGFCAWYSTTVERSPDSEYKGPDDAVLVNSSETINTGGVAILETYMPQFVLDLQKIILVSMDGDTATPSGPSLGAGVLTQSAMMEIAANVLDISFVFNKVLEAVGATGGVEMQGSTQALFTDLDAMYHAPPYLVSQLLAMRRLTPASIMQTLYAGLGILVKQSEGGFILTDEVSCMKGAPVAVNADNIVSITGSFDTSKIPKQSAILFDESGAAGAKATISDNSIRNQVRSDLAVNKGNDLTLRATPGASISTATGTSALITMEPIPLLQLAKLSDAVLGGGGDTVTLTLGDRTVEVPVNKIKKAKDTMVGKKDITDTEESRDLSPVLVKAKQLLLQRMQEMMGLKAIMGSSSKTAVVDGTTIGFFCPVTISGGEISLQKAVMTPGSIEQVTEEGSIEDSGFITSITVTAHAGIVTSSINYVSLSNTYKGIF
jgi:hypothetical protein